MHWSFINAAHQNIQFRPDLNTWQGYTSWPLWLSGAKWLVPVNDVNEKNMCHFEAKDLIANIGLSKGLSSATVMATKQWLFYLEWGWPRSSLPLMAMTDAKIVI